MRDSAIPLILILMLAACLAMPVFDVPDEPSVPELPVLSPGTEPDLSIATYGPPPQPDNAKPPTEEWSRPATLSCVRLVGENIESWMDSAEFELLDGEEEGGFSVRARVSRRLTLAGVLTDADPSGEGVDALLSYMECLGTYLHVIEEYHRACFDQGLCLVAPNAEEARRAGEERIGEGYMSIQYRGEWLVFDDAPLFGHARMVDLRGMLESAEDGLVGGYDVRTIR